MVFKQFSTQLQKLIKEKGFLEPTLPQKMGIPKIMKGDNVLVIAPTGIGKTETVMLPLLDKIDPEKDKPISVLYITPLRALNRDLLDRLFWWADKLEVEIAVRHGDTTQSERAAQREMPSHIFITTPETLQAMLSGKRMREHLKNVNHVVVDEIHELVDSKRGIQLSLSLERLKEVAGDFQRVGLSATVGSPQVVADFLGNNVQIVYADTTKEYEIKVENPKPSAKDRAIAEDLYTGAETAARLRRLYDLIQSHRSVLTFTNTRETAEVLSSRLRKLDSELKHSVHHGSLSKEIRIKGEQEFKTEKLKALIATSSLELGIDIGSIDLVVQYQSPRQVVRLIQRVGRSGHNVGEKSKGIILSGEEDLFESTIIANNAMRGKLEKVKLHHGATDVLANQIIGVTMDQYEISNTALYRMVKRSYPFKDFTKKQIDEIVKFLETLRLVWIEPSPLGYKVGRRRKAFQYFFENLSMISDTKKFLVISVIENEPIGSLDEAFVAEHGHTGEKFVVSGRAWRVIQVDGNKVMVEPIDDIESSIPAWVGEMIPVPFEISQGVGKLRKFISGNIDKKGLAKEVMKKYRVDINAAKEMIKIIKDQKNTHTVPDDRNFMIETYKDFVIIHCTGGTLVNDTIGRYLAAVLSEKTGVSVNIKLDPYRIILQTLAKPEIVLDTLKNSGDLEEVLIQDLERSSLFKWRFLHIARRFGVLSKHMDYAKVNMNKVIDHYSDSPVYKETLREILLEKMDVENAKNVLEDIRKGKIKIEITQGLSLLGENGLVQQFKEVMKPRMPEKEIFNAFKKRLLRTKVRLLCVNCGDYSISDTVDNIKKQPECPKCESTLIAILRKYDRDAQKILKKRLKKKSLNKEEMKELQTIKRSADLTIVYGKTAAIVMAGRGIGPQTASRLLARMHPTREKLLRDVLKAEKEFVRTRVYWS